MFKKKYKKYTKILNRLTWLNACSSGISIATGRPHYQVTTPNEMHQFDLLYMPSDTLYGNKYKYILPGIDAASRYKVVRPLRTKQARDVAEMVGPLMYPSTFQCDNGSEFKGEVTKTSEKQEVKIQ